MSELTDVPTDALIKELADRSDATIVASVRLNAVATAPGQPKATELRVRYSGPLTTVLMLCDQVALDAHADHHRRNNFGAVPTHDAGT